KKIAVKIPPGVTEGSTIRLKGQGESAFGHNTAGDLLLKIKIKPDDRFALNGYDLHSEVAISPWEAALGTKVDIETSNGLVRLKIPAGTQSGRQFRLKGKGLPKKLGSGDLLITARITIPDSLSDTERKLFAELAEKSAFDPRETYQKQTVKEAA
ncbi:MAG: DnaJ C-terminal domain-containing protein, partial [Desulfofustis sp.]